MKAVVAAFNQEKALVGAFSVLTNRRMELFQALVITHHPGPSSGPGPVHEAMEMSHHGGHIVLFICLVCG